MDRRKAPVILSHPDYAVWLLEDGGGEAVSHAAAGALHGLPHPDVAAGDGELKRLYLLASHQSGGWGGRMFDTAVAWLQRDGPRTLWIGVWSKLRLPSASMHAVASNRWKAEKYIFPVGRVEDLEFILRRPPAATPPAAASHLWERLQRSTLTAPPRCQPPRPYR